MNIIFPHEFQAHIRRLIDLGIVIGKDIALPPAGDFSYNMVFDCTDGDKLSDYRVYVLPTSIIVKVHCIKHKCGSNDEMKICTEEIRGALNLLLFTTDIEDMELMYYMGILTRHLESVKIHV